MTHHLPGSAASDREPPVVPFLGRDEIAAAQEHIDIDFRRQLRERIRRLDVPTLGSLNHAVWMYERALIYVQDRATQEKALSRLLHIIVTGKDPEL